MPLSKKSGRSSDPLIQPASGYFEYAIARSALEMVMVSLARAFVYRADSGRIDLLQPAIFNQEFQVAINGRLVQRSYGFAAGLQYFLHPQGPVRLSEYLLDRVPLIRHPFHLCHPNRRLSLLLTAP